MLTSLKMYPQSSDEVWVQTLSKVNDQAESQLRDITRAQVYWRIETDGHIQVCRQICAQVDDHLREGNR